ncbi:J domain-containing protein [Malaciobacter mytili]|uniref:Molecular chaperone DnaJ n=1 Tax=Malaciobacter mytili LMG 24559 TaxID=1032238 RepID=A0AAX2AKA1_9BACT|nr:J domain-containing protein [Malaciobacter mytili]AXH14598.1 DnaJ domain-containing protein [Malaciobacter mytili LMG 24559]RXI47479.1 molecular chaperone DnaJ [Malaciobacter mytili]RXK16650.1 molecular chaperone DnaJ [Malaciobacter mytili LMG 24559]
MNNNTIIYIFNKLLRVGILLFILYLIFTNFGTFLIILVTIFLLGYFFVYKKLKKMSNGFKFTYTQNDFRQNSNFDFKDFDFNSFNQQFAQKPTFNEVEKAKEFFGFTHNPTKEEVKKRYKELAKKYHPDINNSDDTLMQELNHYKDVLLKYVG